MRSRKTYIARKPKEDKLTAIQDIIELDRVPKNVKKEDLVEMLRWLIEEYI